MFATGERLRSLAVALVFAALSFGGCGGGQTRGMAFDRGWSSDGGAAIEDFRRSFKAKIPLGTDVAVGVTGEDTIAGVLLDGGEPWTFEHALDARPAVAGRVVVGLGDGELFALDARTGNLLWERAVGGFLRGIGDDGVTTVVSLAAPLGTGSTVLAIARDGSVNRQIEDEEAIGVPSVVDGYAFLPWAGRFVTVYDLSTGTERARVELPTPTSRAFTEDGTLFFGELGATRFDDRIRYGPTNGATTLLLPDVALPGKPQWMTDTIGGALDAAEQEVALPGKPRWMTDGTSILQRAVSVFDEVRLYARPAPSGPAAIVGGHFAATYVRLAMGFDGAGVLAWSHVHPTEFVGGAAYSTGFALCDAAGKVTFFDGRSGSVEGEVSLGGAVGACVVQADGFTRPPARVSSPPSK